MWSANILLMAVGIPLFIKAARESTVFSFTLKPQPADGASDGDSS